MTSALLAAASAALAAGLLTRALLPPSRRLRTLLHADPTGGPAHPGLGRPGGLRLPPSLERGLARRLRQAGLTRGRTESEAVLEHCARVAGRGAVQGVVLALAAVAAGAGVRTAAVALVLGAVAGGGRRHAGVERVLEDRRERLRVELYTVNQLLALDVRAGGGVAQALERVSRRGQGVLAEELGDVLAAVRAGVPLVDALEEAARLTPEPAAGRTYRLLAKGSQFGTDLATGLRALNEDLRAQRMEAVERAATRRRAAMLLPIVGLLAPVMLLFVAAPLPSILFGTR